MNDVVPPGGVSQRGDASPRVVCGDLQMRIDRNGTWFYHGTPIGRKEMVRLFASVLRRYPDGSYWLVTPHEAGRVEVEDAPFLAVEAQIAGSGRDTVVSVRTNVDDTVTIDAEHPLKMVSAHGGEPIPYVVVRDGLDARLTRSVYYELVAHGCEYDNGKADADPLYGIWSRGTFFPLGSLGGTS